MVVCSPRLEETVEVKEAVAPMEVVKTFPYISLKPLLYVMQAFGLFHSRHFGPRGIFWQVYSACSCIIVFSSLARSFCIIDVEHVGFNNVFFQHMVVIIWLVWCFGSGFAMYRIWAVYEKGPAFLLELHTVVDCCQLKHHCYKHNLRRRAVIVTGLSLFWIAMNTITTIYFLETTIALGLGFILSPKWVYDAMPQWGKYVSLVVASFTQLVNSAFWCLPPAFNHCLCYAMMMELKSFNKAFDDAVKEDATLGGLLARFRKRHQRVAKLVESADSFLGIHISVTLGCSMILLIFLVYNSLWDNRITSSPQLIITQFMWIFTTGAFAGVILHSGASVNKAAHESLSRLHDIEIEDTQGNKDNAELSLFINKLSGPPIGLTALGLFVINKPSVLTTLGMFLTYFIIVVQFRLPSEPAAYGNSTISP
ncbi:uncharacterized protein LOC135482844 [Lineus longissimus]|uniref:uncharacterized protein LOC135482844 n=1 Tax=Lineus longissimus TaxID=88925 RepID=UPI002B4C79E1